MKTEKNSETHDEEIIPRTRSGRIRLILLACGVFLAGAAAATALWRLVWERHIQLNQLFVSERDVLGVDVSSWQGEIDFDCLADQDIRFAYIKATEGSAHIDPCFKNNWENVLKSGMYRGAYHFFSFDSGGDTQAENFIRTVGTLDEERDLIPAIDVEYYGDKENDPPAKEKVVEELRRMLLLLEEEYHAKPMIYTSREFYRTFLKGHFEEYPFWVQNTYYPARMDGWRDWTVWQYSVTGILDGYSGAEKYIDLNVLSRKRTLDDLRVVSH